MKIGLFGYGKMNKLIEMEAIKSNHSIIGTVRKNDYFSENLDRFMLEGDVYIDFSHHDAVLKNAKLCARFNKPLIIGTTGWEKHFQEVKSTVNSSSIGCLYSPNFSIGVALFKEIVSYAAKLMARFKEYDISGVEYHHNQKKDSPSGTAKMLSEQINTHINNPVTFTSVRCGSFPGTHELYFDSPIDTICLSHEARNREGFAVGALRASEWLIDKKGFFSMSDFLSFET